MLRICQSDAFRASARNDLAYLRVDVELLL